MNDQLLLTTEEAFYFILGSRPIKWILKNAKPKGESISASYHGIVEQATMGLIVGTLKQAGLDVHDDLRKKQTFELDIHGSNGAKLTISIINQYLEFELEEKWTSSIHQEAN